MRGRVDRRYTSKEEVRQEIKRRYAAKLPVTHRGLAHSEDFPLRDNALLTAGKQFVTVHGWEVILGAGAFRKSSGSRGKPVAFSSCFDSQTIVEIARLAAWHPTRRERLQKFYGDWDSTLKNAGIDLLKIRPAWVQVRSARLREKAKRQR